MASPKKKLAPEQQRVAELKVRYLEYYKELPIQRYAAMSVARDEDTILRWKAEDADFADAVTEAKAAWVRKKAGKVRAEFALERLEKEIWSPRQELSGPDGKELPTPILGGTAQKEGDAKD